MWDVIALCAGRQEAYPAVCPTTRQRVAVALRAAAKGTPPKRLYAELRTVLNCRPRELLDFPTHSEPTARFLGLTRVLSETLKLSPEFITTMYTALDGWKECTRKLILDTLLKAMKGVE